MTNKDIRLTIRKSGLYNWQVAACVPLSESHFSKWLRHELDDTKRKKVLNAIEKAKKEYL